MAAADPLTKQEVLDAVNAGKVIEITSQENLKALFEHLDEPEGVDEIPGNGTMIMAYASWCGHCKHLKPEYDEAAEKLAGKFPLAKIDASALNVGQVAGFKIQGYPTVVLAQDANKAETLQFGSDKYKGERTADDIVKTIERAMSKPVGSGDEAAGEGSARGGLTKEAVLDAVKSGRVVELNSRGDVQALLDLIDEPAGVDEIPSDGAIVMAYASWCGHCKKMKPTFQKVAEDEKGKFVVARVDASAAGVDHIGGVDIEGYPTVVLIRDANPDKEDGDIKTKEYSDKRTNAAMEDAIAKMFGVKQVDDALLELEEGEGEVEADNVAAAAGDAHEGDFVDETGFELAADEPLDL